jgi:hypothetical protein
MLKEDIYKTIKKAKKNYLKVKVKFMMDQLKLQLKKMKN